MISARNVVLLIREIDRVKRLTWFERLIERIRSPFGGQHEQ